MTIYRLIVAGMVAGLLSACGSSSSDGDTNASSSSSQSVSSETSVSSDSSASSSEPASPCDETLYLCDDFSRGDTALWEILSEPANVDGPDGSFAVVTDGGNQVLQFTANNQGGVLALLTEEAMAEIPGADYFVEARIRPRENSTTSNKFLFLLARYQDKDDWYGGGLNVQNALTSTKVEVAVMEDGTIDRPVQMGRPIVQGARDELDGQWYTVRFELIGPELTVYLDGEKIGTTTDTAFTDKGRIGLYTYNKSFELDDLKVGDPVIKPVQLTFVPSEISWSAEAGDPNYVIEVTARQNDGETADTFTVTSSNAAVVSVAVEGTTVSLTPVAEGTAQITFTSGSDPSVMRTISAEVAPAFIQPEATYSALSDRTMPVPGATDVPLDTPLRLQFNSEPTLGEVGSLRIFRADDDTLVDTVRLSDETDQLGYEGQDRRREMNVQPFFVKGDTVTASLHTGVLEPGTEYYVAIGDGVLNDAQLGGANFVGLGKAAQWTFTTRATLPEGPNFTVDDDGAADFRTVQGALNHVMEYLAKDDATTISIMNGVYHQPLYLRNKNNVTLSGESRDGTVLQYRNSDAINGGTSNRNVFLVESADMLTLENLTLRNTILRSDPDGAQAETLYFNSDDGRLVAKNAAFYSEQDTLLIKGYSWFYQTLVAGNVDFIWGYPQAALFEESEIRTIGDSRGGSGGGYVLQARAGESGKGFVFLNSRLTNGPGPAGNTVADGSTYLARSGGSESYYDTIAFINCEMGDHIADIGWAGEGINDQPAPNPDPATATMGWREYGSITVEGQPIDLSARHDSVYILNDSEMNAELSTRAQIFEDFGTEGWEPMP
ncbi:pectinesterase family protein [Marinimicrobium agarilyticum]|uniref:pectinesterase family protein n=1 Tax=Marinimicrobium agarilyticum TaxID=306546 RepID=UPI000405D806|nr:pectinesterase family protein [Marinimicrobium agarilyticum]